MKRLDKYISNSSGLSRSEVKKLIKAGAVTVDDALATDPALKLNGNEDVCIDGTPIAAPKHRYFMLHKPAGVVSATKDADHPTALDLLYEARADQLQIAGRLDLDTTGLLLITDDGKWNHRLTAPRSDCDKRYRVWLAEPVEDDYACKLAKGVWLDNEKRRCLPAQLTIVSPTEVLLTIQEGKYHQVKRMFAALGNHVTALHREAVGAIELDPNLAPGDYRPLSQQEIDAI